MKKIGKILLVCILFLGVVSFMKEDTVEAAVGGTFTAKIKNIKLDGSTQEIDWNFVIIEESTGDELGKVAIDIATDVNFQSIEGSVVIPEKVSNSTETYRVTEIGERAFYKFNLLKNVTAENPANIIKIRDMAFKGCASLESTGIENYINLESIEDFAFNGCTSLTSTGLGRNNLIKSIKDSTFEGCTSLTSTGLDDNTSVENIGEYAFYGCTSLTNTGLERNNSIKIIEESAFEGCTSLTSTGLDTNTTVKEIGEYVFYECTSLTNTGLERNNTIKIIGKSVFEGCTSLTSTGLETNNSIEKLGEGAFAGCTSLSDTGLESNNTVTELGMGAFYNCLSLTNTGLEKNTTVKTLEGMAFGGCLGLISTGLSKNTSVESIGDEAFVGCTNLTAFYFVKDSIPTLGTDTFPSTTTLYYYSGMTADEVNKLREPRKAYEMIEVGVDSDSLRDDYIAGEEFTLEDVNFNVTYGDTALGEAVSFVNPVLYDDDINSFTFTPVTLVKGVNTIAGKYQGKDFSFEVNAIASSYDVTVKNGTSPKTKYEEGETVTITANAPESGKTFKNWKVESGGVTLADASKKSTTFVMPKSAVVVEAQYETVSVPPVVEEPEIIIGAGFTYQINRNRDMEVTCSGKLEDLMEVYVDGVILHKDHYTLRSGSTIITLKASYLNTLTVGKHTLKLQYKGDVSAETYFLIAGDGQEGTKTPSTGDKTMVGLWMMSMLCAGGYIVYGYKKRHREIEKS